MSNEEKDKPKFEHINYGEGDYTVQEQDTIFSIAQTHLLNWKDIWDAPENEELKKNRKHPGILMAGDKVYLPPPKKYKTHKRYTIKLKQSVKVAIRIVEKGKLYANKKYKLEAGGVTVEDVTDSFGVLVAKVPINAKDGKITLFEEDNKEIQIKIGSLNPFVDLSGIQQRLKNLGYYSGEVTGELDEDTENAIVDFQMANGLAITLELKNDFYNKLLSLHGH